MRKARILKLIGGWYTIEDLTTKAIYDAKASGKLRYMRLEEDSAFLEQVTKRVKKEIQIKQVPPKVGDIVSYDDSDINKPIQEIFPRKNELKRPDIANVDQALLLFSTIEPHFNFNLLDQFLVLIEKADIKPLIIVTKKDLVSLQELTKLKNKLSYYQKIGYQLYYVNSKEKSGFDDLKKVFTNKVTVLAGQTGVGKSTLINALMPELNIETQAISRALGRGKHTTRHTELYHYYGGYVADTPGFSKLDFNIFNKEELKQYFIEFEKYNHLCQFKNKCNHVYEPNCNVKNNPEILLSRRENYQKFFKEIEFQKERY